MKTFLSAAILFSIILFSAISSLVGAGIMVYSLYAGNSSFFTGFITCCLGAILFLSTMTVYMVSKILSSSSVIVEVLDNLVSNEINKQSAQSNNPFQSMFNGLSGMPGITSIKVAKMDEDGNIQSVSDSNVSGLEEVLKSLTAGIKGEKKLEDMTIEELDSELNKEIARQGFERASKIRDLITEKKNSKK